MKVQITPEIELEIPGEKVFRKGVHIADVVDSNWYLGPPEWVVTFKQWKVHLSNQEKETIFAYLNVLEAMK